MQILWHVNFLTKELCFILSTSAFAVNFVPCDAIVPVSQLSCKCRLMQNCICKNKAFVCFFLNTVNLRSFHVSYEICIRTHYPRGPVTSNGENLNFFCQNCILAEKCSMHIHKWRMGYYSPGLGNLLLVAGSERRWVVPYSVEEAQQQNRSGEPKTSRSLTLSLWLVLFFHCVRLKSVWGMGDLEAVNMSVMSVVTSASSRSNSGWWWWWWWVSKCLSVCMCTQCALIPCTHSKLVVWWGIHSESSSSWGNFLYVCEEN